MLKLQAKLPDSPQAKLILLLLLTAGLLGNCFPLDIPLVFLYLPGSIFTLLIFRLYGAFWGGVCALLSSSVLPFSVGHPYVVIWYFLEFCFIAWLTRGKKQQNLILSDAVYWVCLGSPLVLFSFMLLGVNLEVGLLISAKNCANGVANATLASLLVQNLPLRRWLLKEEQEPQTALAHQLYTLLVGFLILPAVVMLIAHLIGSVTLMETRIGQELREKASSLNAEFDLLAMNMTQQPEGHRSRLVKLLQEHWRKKNHEQGPWTLTLLNYNKVLLSTSTDYAPGDQYTHLLRADIEPAGHGALHRIPHASRFNVPLAARWRNSSYLYIRDIDAIPGWRLVVEKPVKPFLSELRWTAIRTFGLLVLLFYPALYLAQLLSNRISLPLARLSLVTNRLPARLQRGETDLDWPSSRIDEIDDLIYNCQEMSQTLQGTFNDLKQAQQSLEERVLKRTEELASVNLSLQQNQSRLDHLAHHDSLTDLPNRLLFKDRLEHAIATSRRTGRRMALLFLDLDRFKTINDSLGHDCGDRLLCVVAERLALSCRGSDTVARLGGDEFILLLEDISSSAQITSVAQKILRQVAQPVNVAEQTLYTTTSIGVSLFPNDGDSADTLMKCADTAMYRAKEMGRNNFQFYTADMDAHAHELLLLESSLRQALDNQQLELYYQPQLDLESGQLVGFEALVRWDHPEHGLLLPKAFIPLAEETGLIEPIGAWVLQTACRQIKHWQDRGYPPVRVAVNISARQFRSSDLLEMVRSCLDQADLEARWLELELTESMVMDNTERAILIMRELDELGIELAIDDFGSGYSSLAYLKRFPISKLKIAQEFVNDILKDKNDAAIADSVIALARSMKLQVIAEGVENAAQCDLLRQRGCHQGQGYFFSNPLPAAAVPDYYQTQNIPPQNRGQDEA